MEELQKNISRTLLYFNIFSHPLKAEEIFTYLRQNSVPFDIFNKHLNNSINNSVPYDCKDGYYYIKPHAEYIESRISKENYSLKMWKRAAWATKVIKVFPFVRAVMITGSLSKNSSDKSSDLDFMVITSPNRLWISRTLLMLFKKIFLLNSYKYFCINYFITENNLEIEDKNFFTAVEIITIKSAFNHFLVNKFVEANNWVKQFFPNYIINDPSQHKCKFELSQKTSLFQKFMEKLIPKFIANKLDNYFLKITKQHWQKKYHYLNKADFEHMFKSSECISKAHPGNMQKNILSVYEQQLKKFNL